MTLARHLEVTFEPRNGPQFIINPKEFALISKQTFIKFQVEKQVSSEPNSASLELYNLSEDHTAGIDFKFDLYAKIFGAKVTIRGGYIEDGVVKINQMYSGVITQALTTKEAPDRITRIELRNIYFELMRRPVNYQVSPRISKADAILTVIKDAGGQIESGQEAAIRANLLGYFFDEDESIEGTLDEVLTRFSKGLPRRIIIYWDDAGVSFDPLGKPSAGRPVKIISEDDGLIGVPKTTTSGFEFETRLDATYRINDPVVIKSIATDRLSLAAARTVALSSTGALGVVFSGTTVVSKMIHSGDNREGDFKTSVTTKFIDLIKQVGQQGLGIV